MDNTLKLKKPIVHGSETITELIFSEPTAKEMRVLIEVLSEKEGSGGKLAAPVFHHVAANSLTALGM